MHSLTQFFSYMNDIQFPYVVLRNWEMLPDSVQLGPHSDLDLLVYDHEHFQEIFPEAEAEYPYPRVRFKMPIDVDYIYIDVRHVGDDYYPRDFEQAILDEREWNLKGFFTPNALHHRLALAYHVVHHKGTNKYKRWLGNSSVNELLEALKSSTIGWVEPNDPSVGRFNPYWKGATSIVSRKDGSIIKKQTGWKGYNLEENELRILSGVNSRHFPFIEPFPDGDGLVIEDCGEPLTEHNLPEDWKKQIVEILADLKSSKIIHRDIKPDNLMVKDGVVKLIDFGWARLIDDVEDHPPSCLGFPYKPSYGFDDNFSMRKVVKELEYKVENKKEGVFV